MVAPRFNGYIGVLLLTLAAIPLLAEASGRKRPPSVHLKPPVANMPIAKKTARPPERRKSDVSMPKAVPGAINQPAPAYLQPVTKPSSNATPVISIPAPNSSAGPTQAGPPAAVPRQAQGQDAGRRSGLPLRLSSIRLFKQASLKKFGRHAYASMKSIFIRSGQEKHLPHEAWHVVQTRVRVDS